jgi:hypothetical protein
MPSRKRYRQNQSGLISDTYGVLTRTIAVSNRIMVIKTMEFTFNVSINYIKYLVTIRQIKVIHK